jgi:nucleotide-binding universal stress UspA family protein
MIHVRRILYPTDFSPYSNQAYFHAVAMAEHHKASLTILYVFVPGSKTDETDRRHWREQLEQIRPANPAIAVHHVLLEGDPAAETVRYAVDAGMDLVVMGTHGRSGLERLLVGSVTERVMREAPCSVMAVKLPRGMAISAPTDVALAGSPA